MTFKEERWRGNQESVQWGMRSILFSGVTIEVPALPELKITPPMRIG